MSDSELSVHDLPSGWSARVPTADDTDAILELVAAHREQVGRPGSVDAEMIRTQLVGIGSWTRRQLVVLDDQRLVAWLSVHDRAAGRTVVEPEIHPDLPADVAAHLAHCLLDAGKRFAVDIARVRGLRSTLLDAHAYAVDERQQQWLARSGYEQVRTWWHMARPVDAGEAHSLPGPREGVTVRRVEQNDDGLPVAQDLQTVHRLLEESFQDHFSSYRESFPEFVLRLREDPGHRWDHWWLALIDQDGEQLPAGAVVSSVSPPDATGVEGSYIDYIGVHRRARGHGVAKALLHTVIADAAARGRNRVSLEVDADSPTGAEGLYESMGWATSYVSQSWHQHLTLLQEQF